MATLDLDRYVERRRSPRQESAARIMVRLPTGIAVGAQLINISPDGARLSAALPAQQMGLAPGSIVTLEWSGGSPWNIPAENAACEIRWTRGLLIGVRLLAPASA